MENPADLSPPHLYANRKQWNRFLSYFLLGTGIAFTVVGIIFFFAYNWNYLPKFVKFGIVEVLLIATVLLATFTSWNRIIKQSILTGSAFLIGTLFAVFGQVYQTGADSYLLFLLWTIFILLWALAICFVPLWLIFIGLLCTTLGLYGSSTANNHFALMTIQNYIIWILAIATIIAEYLYVKGKLANYNYWFIILTTTATLLLTSILFIHALFESIVPGSLVLTTVILFIAGILYGWKQKRLFHIATILFASLIILISLITRSCNLDIFFILLLMIITIVGTISIIRLTLTLKKQWYETEE